MPPCGGVPRELVWPSVVSPNVMKTIPREVVEPIIERFEALDENELQPRFKRFSEEQPHLMTYLLVGDEEFVEEERRGDLIYLGLLTYEVLSGERGGLPSAGEEVVVAADDANLQTLMSLDESSEAQFAEANERMLATYNQRHLLTALLEILMAGNEETPELAPESVGTSLMHLKTVIDCLDR